MTYEHYLELRKEIHDHYLGNESNKHDDIPPGYQIIEQYKDIIRETTINQPHDRLSKTYEHHKDINNRIEFLEHLLNVLEIAMIYWNYNGVKDLELIYQEARVLALAELEIEEDETRKQNIELVS